MEIKIDSNDPQHTVGEILTRGAKSCWDTIKTKKQPKAFRDGWYRTGDLGIMDENGNLFIKGRSKNMLLGASGQNIYPEEIEDLLNNLTLVNESIVIQKGEKLYGLVYPDFESAQSGFTRLGFGQRHGTKPD